MYLNINILVKTICWLANLWDFLSLFVHNNIQLEATKISELFSNQ